MVAQLLQLQEALGEIKDIKIPVRICGTTFSDFMHLHSLCVVFQGSK